MKRFTFNILSDLSLLLLVGIFFLWFRARSGTEDRFRLPQIGKYYCEAVSVSGKLELGATRYDRHMILTQWATTLDHQRIPIKYEEDKTPVGTGWYAGLRSRPLEDVNPRLFEWFDIGETSSGQSTTTWRAWVGLPYWSIALACTVLPLWRAMKFFREKNQRAARQVVTSASN